MIGEGLAGSAARAPLYPSALLSDGMIPRLCLAHRDGGPLGERGAATRPHTLSSFLVRQSGGFQDRCVCLGEAEIGAGLKIVVRFQHDRGSDYKQETRRGHPALAEPGGADGLQPP